MIVGLAFSCSYKYVVIPFISPKSYVGYREVNVFFVKSKKGNPTTDSSEFFTQAKNYDNDIFEGFSSKLEEGKIVYLRSDTPERVKLIHQQIYAKRPDVHYVFHNKSEAVMTISRRVNHMRPLLDDFAQIIGTSVRIPTAEGAPLVIKKKINAVFAYNDGAYCLGDTEENAKAAAIILDKGCIAHIAVMRFGEGRFISLKDCFKMNRNYRKNYSVLANSVK